MKRFMPDNEEQPFPDLIFQCRWRYGPGNFCSVHVPKSQQLCGLHEGEERDRLAALVKLAEAKEKAA